MIQNGTFCCLNSFELTLYFNKRTKSILLIFFSNIKIGDLIVGRGCHINTFFILNAIKYLILISYTNKPYLRTKIPEVKISWAQDTTFICKPLIFLKIRIVLYIIANDTTYTKTKRRKDKEGYLTKGQTKLPAHKEHTPKAHDGT